MDNAGDDDDPRLMELETLEAIYPEIRHALSSPGPSQEGEPRFTFELELPVQPAKPVTVLFPAASSGVAQAERPAPASASTPAALAVEPVDSLLVSHLPPLSLKITLPDGYPSDKPPAVTISTTPQWLPDATLRVLEDDGPRLWEEAGRDMIAYTYIDHLHREAENVFGAINTGFTLEVDPDHKLAVLDYDINAKKAAFEKETFECGICLGEYASPRTLESQDLHKEKAILTKRRPQKGLQMPQNDGLRPYLLPPMPARLLHRRHQGRKPLHSPLSDTKLC